MSLNSQIEWTDATWNPVRGCTKISPGCKHCYAETFAERFRGVKGHPYEQGFDLRLVPEKLTEPFAWRSPKLVFVNSMSDLFHKDVPTEYIHRVFDVMNRAAWHRFQILTKRSQRLARLSPKINWQPHIWMGVSVESQEYTFRIDHLRETQAYVKFLSLEPLLGPLPNLNLQNIDWVIVGGESGPGARPMRSLPCSGTTVRCWRPSPSRWMRKGLPSRSSSSWRFSSRGLWPVVGRPCSTPADVGRRRT